MIIINILAFVFVLGLVIVIHELGHFIMAKRAGILCHEFSLGMGPILYSKKKGETLFAIRAIPIGGFVMMAGEEINDDMIAKDKTIAIRKNQDGVITDIIVDPKNTASEDAETITVESFNLSGDPSALNINRIPVKPDAHYVFKDKRIQIAPEDRRFDSKSVLARFKAIVAGPFMNFVLAFFLFVILAFIIGFPKTDAEGDVTTTIGSVEEGYPADGILEVGDTITHVEGEAVGTWDEFSAAMFENRGNRSIDIRVKREDTNETVPLTPTIEILNIGISSAEDAGDDVIIAPVADNTPAQNAGLEGGDEIVEIDDEAIHGWQDVIDALEANTEGERMVVEVLREGSDDPVRIHVSPHEQAILDNQNVDAVQVRIGVSPEYEGDFLQSFAYGFSGIAASSTMIFDTLRLLFNSTVGVSDLAGPVGIYSITSSALEQGFVTFLNWTALLSVNLGILNLLPIPALDGGRLVFLGYEGITRRKVNRKVENYLHAIMFILLMGLFLFITYHDILRLFNIG
ncbi:MAG: RIP metalloprotease RseP [Candidatus Izemoplasmataceae bacterium]